MPAKKIIITDTGFTDDYSIVGISTHLKDYRLAWYLNDKLKIELRKKQDFISATPTKTAGRAYSFFHYYDELFRYHYFLLSNKADGAHLFGKWAHISFLLLIKSEGEDRPGGRITELISTIPQVLHNEILDTSTERQFPAMIEDL